MFLAMRRAAGIVLGICVLAALIFVADQARRTLVVLDDVERQRDAWQRPDEIIRRLDPKPGDTVVDFGSGAGYFSLRIAPRISPGGRVLAVDLRRLSLAFLWMRATARDANVNVIHGQVEDPALPPGPVDAVLIANTYHELAAPDPIVTALFNAMRSGARLVVVDRFVHGDAPDHSSVSADDGVSPEVVEAALNRRGFRTVEKDLHFIELPAVRDFWWLMVLVKP